MCRWCVCKESGREGKMMTALGVGTVSGRVHGTRCIGEVGGVMSAYMLE